MGSHRRLAALEARYDLVIVGGGITGAGVLREAVRTGARVLLVEAGDYASGTSSWSSKLVHGGLRYLKEGQWRLTLESVRERERLRREAPGLVEPQPFLMPIYAGRKPGRALMQVGLFVYDLMAGSRKSRWLPRAAALAATPELRTEGLQGAMAYEDAQTDDARLVLRLILEAQSAGAAALNHVRAELLQEQGRVRGVRLHDRLDGSSVEVEAGVVVNATGAWAGALPGAPAGAPKLRPLRGSHLVFPAARLPLRQAVSWLHPRDGRPVFAYPWEGATLYGTTDLDHEGALETPRITSGEVAYLMEALDWQFPQLRLAAREALCSYAGVRPVVASGKDDPSAESRESALWTAPGLVGITGGKLTTFRVTAREVLAAAAREVPALVPAPEAPVLTTPAGSDPRLCGRLGAAAEALQREFPAEAVERVGDTPYRWAELRWALRHEQVARLDDLMLRRTRLGLVAPQGAAAFLPRIATLCREELGWDEARWAHELAAWQTLWQTRHAPPEIDR
ncbi:MAG TPA: glycerol-3-phosphate dehydrogenase/oxidase [Solimonas sp.]|nr:glycerol-3-phosphate dehydrogenase/oxidase [Solimonas sp.]